MKRLPPSSGIEIAAGIGDVPQVVTRREQGQEEDELKDYSPSQEAASDPPSDDEQDENEDPGEGQHGIIKQLKQQRSRSDKKKK